MITTQLETELSIIQDSLRASQIGHVLAGIFRWTFFRNGESDPEWQLLLGPTAVVLSHQEHFTHFVQTWVNGLSAQEMRDLLLAVAVHDIGEATIGDIAAIFKTDADTQRENLAAVANINVLDLDDELKQTLIVQYQQIIAGEHASLHYLFQALERTEYLDTAIHLFHQLESGQTMERGPLMVAQVIANDLPRVMAHAQRLPQVVGAYLSVHSQTIDDIFEWVEGLIERGELDASGFDAKFARSKKAWHRRF